MEVVDPRAEVDDVRAAVDTIADMRNAPVAFEGLFAALRNCELLPEEEV